MTNTSNHAHPIKADIRTHFEVSEVNALYEELNLGPHANAVFLSRAWIINWLKAISSPVSLVVFSQQSNAEQNKLVGFALLGKQSAWYGDTYYLNQSGNAQDDQMWIEHNDVICAPQHKALCRKALLTALREIAGFHRLVVSLSTSNTWASEKLPSKGLFIWSSEETPVSFVNIQDLQEQHLAYRSTLSKNTQSAVKRAAKYIERAHGNISMQVCSDNLSSLLSNDIAPLHIQQWASTEHGSGFSNEVFAEFLQGLSKENSEDCRCEVLSFSAGDLVLGHLFNIISNHEVYFYLSAINYADNDNKYKPGMLIHTLAIEHYSKLNMSKYDFLAGQARYKESLSTHSYNMYTVHLAKNTWTHRLLYRINQVFKHLKNRGNTSS